MRYFKPGQVADIEGVAHSRAYVLGPPDDERLIKKSDPSRGERSEVYFTGGSGLLSLVAALRPAAQDPGYPRDQILEELSYPFDTRHRRTEAWSKKTSFFRARYHNRQLAWRRIDTEWLFSAETLALHLDNDTNNTSLALAFELGDPGRGRVLLFPGDAQVGNWLSWRDVSWRVGQRDMDSAELLKRTVLYKVSHHASHNGTVKRDANGEPFGLELMPDGLLAMIPVDHTAASKLRGWDMPYGALYEALEEKTDRNILRADDLDRKIGRPTLQPRSVPGLRHTKWRRSKKTKAGSGAGSLYYDVVLDPVD